MNSTKKINLISLHGGHSGQFCNHAKDSLEDIITQYIKLGFKQVGISEHIPPISNEFLFPDEIEQNLTAVDIYNRFKEYFIELKRLKKKYASQIIVFSGMETESFTGYVDHIKTLIAEFSPDYIVGSVHHIKNICFDFSKQEYERLAQTCGSIESMYENYFDLQYEMINEFKPLVVGHFDLIRIYDTNYENRLMHPDILSKIKRNLKVIKQLNLILDFNLRPLSRGEKEPYISKPILEMAKEMGLNLIPGDDSHGVHQAGLFVKDAIDILDKYGFDTNWEILNEKGLR